LSRKPPQKAPVVALRGNFEKEVISQQQLRDLEGAQRAEWMASKRAALLSEKVKAAIERGASIEPGPLYYDAELEMVRTAKTKTG
jgi:hypothetical protein